MKKYIFPVLAILLIALVPLSAQFPQIFSTSSGGTGTGTTFTSGSVVFAGATGAYAQDNTNFSWDSTGHTLKLGTTPASAGLIRIPSAQAINSRNAANNGDIILIDTTAGDIMRIGASGTQGIEVTGGKVNFGCSTASCVQWNRSGTTFQALLADQSLRANVQVAESNFQTLKSSTNCTSSAAPAVCAAAATGSVVIAAAATTVTVNTTAVTANSAILLTFDSSLGTKLSVTCNTTVPTVYSVSARTAATSFTITATAPTTNPACFSYTIVN